MVLFYDSMTGNTKRFVQKIAQKLNIEAHSIREGKSPQGDFLLITHTFGRGEVPQTTQKFLEYHSSLMRGVACSGSVHWGEMYGKAGDIISDKYEVPLVTKFNKSGFDADVDKVVSWLNEVA